MAVGKKIKSHPDAAEYFKDLLFYIKFIEKPKIKRLKNIHLLSELFFFKELNVIKTDHVLRRYPRFSKLNYLRKKIQLDS